MLSKNLFVKLIVAIILTTSTGVVYGQFFSGANNTTGDISRTGRVSIGSATFPTGLQFLITGGNIGQRQTTGVTFGGTAAGDTWTAIGGNPGVPNLPGLYGLKHQWGQYAINFQLQARSTTNPDTQIKDAVIAWNSSNGSGFGNGNLQIGNIDAVNNFLPRMTFLDNGNIGIGTSTPGERLRIQGSSSGLLNPIVTIRKTNFSAGENVNYIFGINDPETDSPLIFFGGKRIGLITEPLISGNNRILITADATSNFSKSISLNSSGITINAPVQPLAPGTDQIELLAGNIRLGGRLFTSNSSGSIVDTRLEGSFLPTGNNAFNLGSSGFRWTNVFATNGVIQTSDRKEKDNIRTLNYGLDHITKLKPVTFKWKSRPEGGMIVGLIAQDVKEVIPEVVYDPATDIQKDAEGKTISPDPNASMGIRYSDLIPVLINAIKELNQKVEEQAEQLARSEEANGISSGAATTGEFSSKKLKLYQNTPNPFTQSTTINYYLPESVQQARIVVFDMNGEQKLNRSLTQKGDGSTTISSSDLNNGIYFYMLIADGQTTPTLRMIISK
jgi:Chaperone of endosialidase/Secretion system C-terminal sorting domain